MKFTEEQKRFIVIRLAMFDTPSMVCDAFKDEYGQRPERNQIGNYDPTKVPHRISAKLRAIFDKTRETFLKEAASIPIAQRSFRLRRLQMIHDQMMGKGNVMAAANVLEQAAKEAGNVFTNTTKLEGDVNHKHDGEVSFKADQNRASLAELIEQAIKATERKPTKPEHEVKH